MSSGNERLGRTIRHGRSHGWAAGLAVLFCALGACGGEEPARAVATPEPASPEPEAVALVEPEPAARQPVRDLRRRHEVEVPLTAAVRRARIAYEAEGWDPDDVTTQDAEQCVTESERFPGVRRFGSFANDRGCILMGIFVEETYYAEPRLAVPVLLARAGWAEADGGAREEMALVVATRLLHGRGHVVGRPGAAPTASANRRGGVRVQFQTEHTGMRPDSTSVQRHRYRFTADGHVRGR